MRREERVTVQGPVKEQQPDRMSHRGGGGRAVGAWVGGWIRESTLLGNFVLSPEDNLLGATGRAAGVLHRTGTTGRRQKGNQVFLERAL